MGLKIRNHALSQFSEEAFFSRVEQVIEEVLQQSVISSVDLG